MPTAARLHAKVAHHCDILYIPVLDFVSPHLIPHCVSADKDSQTATIIMEQNNNVSIHNTFRPGDSVSNSTFKSESLVVLGL